MILTNNEKLRIVQDKFCLVIRSYNTWEDFKSMFNSLTKEKIKTAIKNALQAGADEKREFSQGYLDGADNLEELKNEVDLI